MHDVRGIKPVVVTVTNNFGMGGVPRLHARVLPLLTEKYEVHLVGYKDKGELFDSLPDQGVQTHFLPSHGRLHWQTIREYASFFRQYKADIVHSHSHSPNVFCPLAAALAHVPARIVQIHNSGLYWFASSAVGRFKQNLEESLVHRLFTDRIVVISEEMRAKYVASMFVPDALFVLLHNGIPLSQPESSPRPTEPESAALFPFLRKQYGIGSEEKVLGFVGRLVPEKGLDYLLQVARELAAAHMAFRIAVVGGGTEAEVLRMRQEAAAVGDGKRVLFLGETADPSAYYRQFDALLFTSQPGFEGMATVVLEAASFGLPVLARRAEPEEELVARYYSRICFFEDFPSPVQAIEATLRLPPDTTGRLGHFSIEAMAERLDHLYSALLAAKK